MSLRTFKTSVYDQLARMGKTLANGSRLELLDLLAQSPRTVEKLANEIGQSVANTSHHLQVLRRAGMVARTREGVSARYQLADARVADLVRALRVLAESQLAELGAIVSAFHRDNALSPSERERLIDKVRLGEVTVVDVRPAPEFDAGHLPGAVSIPLADLERRIADIELTSEVVVYCRGPYCAMAAEAADVLRAHGLAARVLDEGVTDWRARGFEIAK